MSDAHGPTSRRCSAIRAAATPPARVAPQRQEAAAARDPRAARAAGRRLDRLRDDDGRRLRPAGPREPQGVPGRAQLGPRPTSSGTTLGVADHQPGPRSSSATSDLLGVHAPVRDHRHRGPALLRELRRRPARHRPRLRPGRASSRQAAQGGSTIAQQFVKNALQAQAKRTVFQKLREAALAYHLTRKWSKEQDPHRVPQLDLLRQRRLRDRVRGAHLLRQPSPTTRTAARAANRCASSSSSPTRRRCSPASSPPRARYDPVAHPQAAPGAGATSCSRRCSTRAAHRSREYDNAIQRGAARADRHQAAHGRRTQGAVLHDLGPPAARRPVRRPQRRSRAA